MYDFNCDSLSGMRLINVPSFGFQNLTSLDSQAVSTASETVFRPQGPIILFFLNLYIHVYNV